MISRHGLQENVAGVITGASSGIGRALAILLAKKYKARLVLNARTSETLDETIELVHKAGGQAIGLPGDVGNKDTACLLPQTCLEKFGTLDLLVNNAGLAKPGPILSLGPDDWSQVFAVNFFAPLWATYAALPHFVQQGHGKIVNIASVAGKIAFPGSVCYSASKFALTGMSEGMAGELLSKGIDVITVCPGWVRSEFFSKNAVVSQKNPTLIAEKNSLEGWLMRNVLSISSEKCASDIVSACEKGGPQEIVLTAPGKFFERLKGIFPSFTFYLASKIPPER